VAGGVLDRLDRRGVMIAADIVRGGLVLAVPFVAQHSTTGVFALAFFTSCATVFFDPGLMTLLPEIVTDESLLRANSVLEASSHITEIVGFAAAGLVVSYFATRTTFTVDAATFGVSAVTLLAMSLHRVPRTRGGSELEQDSADRHGFWAETREGVSYLLHHAGLRANTLLAVASVAGVGAFIPSPFCWPPTGSTAQVPSASWRPPSPSATSAGRSSWAPWQSACARAWR
jgi:hypothetical protein